MTVPKRAVAVVNAARAWWPVFTLMKTPNSTANQDAIKKRGGLERVRGELRDATDRLSDAVRDLELELKKTPLAKRPRKPIDWAKMFGAVAQIAGVAHQAAIRAQGIPTHVIDTHAEDVSDGGVP